MGEEYPKKNWEDGELNIFIAETRKDKKGVQTYI